MQGLVFKFSPAGNGTKVFVRVISVETGDVFFPNLHIDRHDAQSLMAALVDYRREYEEAVYGKIVVHQFAVIDIPDDIYEKGAALIVAFERYEAVTPEQRGEAAIELERSFLAFRECGRRLEERIDAALGS